MPDNNEKIDLKIQNANVVAFDSRLNQLKTEITDVYIAQNKIKFIGGKARPATQTIDATGLHLIPGAIDTQVHFRDPGFYEKEDFSSGSRAAIMGGVTSVFDMPNTKPPTLTEADLLEKITLAQKKSFCNFGLYVGASPTNVDNLGKLENLSGVCGVKLFMGSSTGNLVVSEDKLIEMALKNGKRRMAIHAEDENRLRERKQIVFGDPNANYKAELQHKAELQFKAELPHSAELQYKPELHPIWRDAESAILATTKILKLARKCNRKIHVLHVSTAEEIEILKKNKDIASFEITPQHLTLHAPDCYLALGTLAQMNPPIRELRHQNALWKAVVDGDVSVLGSDHAPHTLEEKKKSYPDTPSGLTGVQTILPLMLHHAVNKKLSLHRVVELLAQNPARLFGILNKGEIREGFDADLTLVDLKAKKTIENSWIESRCGWTPFDGMKLNAWVKSTILAGQIVMKDDEIIGSAQGKMLKFSVPHS